MAATLGNRIDDAVRTLPPGYFALVMATGIISVGLDAVRAGVLSAVLLWIAVIAFVVLLALSAWRLVAYRAEVAADLDSASTSFGFFTFVAAVNVLAARFSGHVSDALPAIMLVVAFLVWIVLGYAIPWRVVVGAGRGEVLAGLNGTWFVWAVASQSIAVVASGLEPTAGDAAELLSIIAVLAWSIGILMYGTVGIAVVIRALMRGMTAADFGPSYWVTMGAAAITVLAGSRVVEMTDLPMIAVTRGLIAGAAVVFWAFATWLLPGLIAAGWWRHVSRRIPLRYDAELWSMVFPLGMYAVASMYLGQADSLPILGVIGDVFIWLALLVWAIVAAGAIVHIARRLSPRSGAEKTGAESA